MGLVAADGRKLGGGAGSRFRVVGRYGEDGIIAGRVAVAREIDGIAVRAVEGLHITGPQGELGSSGGVTARRTDTGAAGSTS